MVSRNNMTSDILIDNITVTGSVIFPEDHYILQQIRFIW